METAGFIIGKLRETFASAKVSRELPDSTLTFPTTLNYLTGHTPSCGLGAPAALGDTARPSASHCDALTHTLYITGGCLEHGHATPYHPTHLALASSALCWLAQFVLVQVPTTFLLVLNTLLLSCMLPPGDE